MKGGEYRRPGVCWALWVMLSVLGAEPGLAKAQSPVRPGDRVFVRIWGETPQILVDTLVVDSAGRVFLPKVGSVRIGDYTIDAAADTIRARLAEKFTAAPYVAVLRRVIVVGAVERADVLYLDGSATVRDAIAEAGGVAEFGSSSKVTLVRGRDRVPLPNWEMDDASITLQSGDLIVVGRRSWLVTNAVQLASLGVALTSLIVSLRR